MKSKDDCSNGKERGISPGPGKRALEILITRRKLSQTLRRRIFISQIPIAGPVAARLALGQIIRVPWRSRTPSLHARLEEIVLESLASRKFLYLLFIVPRTILLRTACNSHALSKYCVFRWYETRLPIVHLSFHLFIRDKITKIYDAKSQRRRMHIHRKNS